MLLLFRDEDSVDSVSRENLLIVIVEAGQELKGPRGCRLHRVRVLIVGRGHTATTGSVPIDAAAATSASGASITDAGGVSTGVINAVTTAAADGDDAANQLPLQCRRCLLPFKPTQQLLLQSAIDAEELTDRACVKHRHRHTNGEHMICRIYRLML